jgi:hypothetical protein
MNYEYLKQFGLEMARVGLIAVVPILSEMAATRTFDWELVFFAAALAILKGIDRALHEVKAKNHEANQKGVLPF